MYRRSNNEMRVALLAPIGRDARLIEETLMGSGIGVKVCEQPDELLPVLQEGTGTVLFTEESLSTAQIEELGKWLLTAQPPWSDIPFIALTRTGVPTTGTAKRTRELQTLGNLTMLERPVRPETIESSVRSALRARMRQYEVRSRQEALSRVNADLEQFAHSASHDLKEPLRSICVYSELLAREFAPVLGDRGKELLGAIRAGTARMETLLHDLLAYTEAASISEEAPEPTDALEPLQNALANLAESVRESGCDVVYAALPPVRMRSFHMQQLLQNLIGNSIKYRGQDPPRICISAKQTNSHWLFSVADNGMGIRPEYKETIFGIFKRLHTHDRYPGTGIGLAICQRIVERYRGRIWVESEPGKGSTFYFTVPA